MATIDEEMRAALREGEMRAALSEGGPISKNPWWVKPAEVGLETAGMVGGGAIGMAAGPVGGIAGAGLGYAAARQAAQRGKELLGLTPPQTPVEAGIEAAKDIPSGAAMEAGGQVAGTLISKAAGVIGEKAGKIIERGIEKGIRPSVSGKSTFGQFEKYRGRAEDAVKSIIEEKPNLSFTDESGEIITGQLPTNLKQFSDTIGQVKRKIFEKYNSMAESVPEEILTKITGPREMAGKTTIESFVPRPNISYGGKPVQPFPGGVKEPFRGRVDLEGPLPLDVPLSYSGRVETQLPYSHFEIPGKNINRVEFKPISEELKVIANSKVLNDFDPKVVAHAKERLEMLSKRKSYTAVETQDAIAHLNNSLEAFYKNPTYENASTASVDAMIVNRLRSGLDSIIENSTGPGYQELKNAYGALSAVEKDVTHRAIVDARKNIKGLIDFADIFSGSEVVRGIMMMNPTSVGVGFSAKAITSLWRYINNPNRIVSSMFQNAESAILREGQRRISEPSARALGRAGALISNRIQMEE